MASDFLNKDLLTGLGHFAPNVNRVRHDFGFSTTFFRYGSSFSLTIPFMFQHPPPPTNVFPKPDYFVNN